jgi:hypothetical protein
MRAPSSAIIGICIGLTAAAFALNRTGLRTTVAGASGPMVSECDGQIRSVAIQYVSGAGFAIPIYRQFLAALPTDVRMHVLCPDQKSLDELRAALGPMSARLEPILTGHAMTAWSRDRWIALRPIGANLFPTLIADRQENAAEIWPARAGDERIAGDLANALNIQWRRSGLYFDGGDLLADSRSLFVAPGAIVRNIQHTCRDRDELKQLLQSEFHLTPILLDDAPDHHAGMFMMAAGDGRIVVGDPSLAKPLLATNTLPGGPDFSESTQKKFDSVATAAATAGYQVIRIPCVPATDGKTYITYVNGIIDHRDGQRTIYMPSFQGQEKLNSAGQAVWESLGYRVIPIDVTSAYGYFGTLHCLVNVIEKI